MVEGSMNLRLRDVEERDLAQVWSLNQAAVPTVNSVPIEFFRFYAGLEASHPKQPAYFKVAVSDPRRQQPGFGSGEVVGFLLGLRPGEDYESINYRWFCNRFDDFLYVDRIVVAGRARRQGLGTMFYNDFVAVARASDPPAERICCEVNLEPRNDRSLAFHEHFGFRQVASLEHPSEGNQRKVVALMSYDIPRLEE